jgi:hypothetical protein
VQQATAVVRHTLRAPFLASRVSPKRIIFPKKIPGDKSITETYHQETTDSVQVVGWDLSSYKAGQKDNLAVY